MQVEYIGKTLDLDELGRQVQVFFTQNQFATKLEKTLDGYKIEAFSERRLNVQLKIKVEIFGRPNDFTVDYTTDDDKKGFFSSSVGKYLIWALGGGIFVLKDEKVKQALEKFETTFWSYVDEKVAQLAQT